MRRMTTKEIARDLVGQLLRENPRNIDAARIVIAGIDLNLSSIARSPAPALESGIPAAMRATVRDPPSLSVAQRFCYQHTESRP
jgi:hypothetical protein